MRRIYKIFTIFIIFVTCSILLNTSTSFAQNLGVWGTVYPIFEEDIKEFIYKRLEAMQQNGELEKIKQKFIENVKEHTLRPTPVSGLTTIANADEAKTFYYDPTLVLNRDIEDANGRILFAKGTKINPLEKVTLHSVLFFFNADDKRQVKWAINEAKNYSYVKYILVQGNIKDTGDVLKNRVYFDQYGSLSKKFGIKHIPCIVSQDGLRLKIQEFSLFTIKEDVHDKK